MSHQVKVHHASTTTWVQLPEPHKKKKWVRWCASVIPHLYKYARQRNRRISRSSEAYRLASQECSARAEIAREPLSQRGVRWRSTAESCPDTSMCALQQSFTDTHYINKNYKNYQVPFNYLKSKCLYLPRIKYIPTDRIFKNASNCYLSWRNTPQWQDTYRPRVKGHEPICQANRNQNQDGIAILISDIWKRGFQTKATKEW